MSGRGNKDAVVAPLPPNHQHNLRPSTALRRFLQHRGTTWQAMKRQAEKACTVRGVKCIHLPQAPTPPPGRIGFRKNARMSTGPRGGERPPIALACICGLNRISSDKHHPYFSTFRLHSVGFTNLVQSIINPEAPLFAYDWDDQDKRSRKEAEPSLVIREP